MFRYILSFYYFFVCLFIPICSDCFDKQKSVLFIVNPISHEIKGQDVGLIIKENLDNKKFSYKIVYTEYPQHATQLAQKALSNSVDIVAAVGGDGTVNEIGKSLIHTKVALAIIPVGSGNGLARHLGIPVGLKEAIKGLNRSTIKIIDTATVNSIPFLCTAGIGFDADVAREFAAFGKRGLWSYCQVAFKEFARYKPKSYQIVIDGTKVSTEAFILTFANSNQYGNGFIIAPNAKMDDSALDLVIIEKIPFFSIPQFIYFFKRGNLHHFSHFKNYSFKELIIHRPFIQAHVDGEPLVFHDSITVSIVPQSLKVLVPLKN